MACLEADAPQPKVKRRQLAEDLASSAEASGRLRRRPSERRKMLLSAAPFQRQYATRGFKAGEGEKGVRFMKKESNNK